MAKSKPIVSTNRKSYAADYVPADYDRAVFLGDPMMDSMFTALTALGANVWAIQRRMRIVELLLEKHGSVTREMIEMYQPTAAEAEQLTQERNTFVAEIYDPFKESGDLAYATSLHVDGIKP